MQEVLPTALKWKTPVNDIVTHLIWPLLTEHDKFTDVVLVCRRKATFLSLHALLSSRSVQEGAACTAENSSSENKKSRKLGGSVFTLKGDPPSASVLVCFLENCRGGQVSATAGLPFSSPLHPVLPAVLPLLTCQYDAPQRSRFRKGLSFVSSVQHRVTVVHASLAQELFFLSPTATSLVCLDSEQCEPQILPSQVYSLANSVYTPADIEVKTVVQ